MCWSSRPGVATCACASADPITHAKHLIADAYSLRPARGTMEAPSKWLQLHPSRLTRRMCCKSTLVSQFAQCNACRALRVSSWR
jgi:hypothetical protein